MSVPIRDLTQLDGVAFARGDSPDASGRLKLVVENVLYSAACTSVEYDTVTPLQILLVDRCDWTRGTCTISTGLDASESSSSVNL